MDVVEEYSTREDIRHVLDSMKSVLSSKEYEVISLPSLSVPMGSYSEISRECFLRDRNNISSSLLIHFPAYVDSRAVFVESNVEIAFINPLVQTKKAMRSVFWM